MHQAPIASSNFITHHHLIFPSLSHTPNSHTLAHPLTCLSPWPYPQTSTPLLSPLSPPHPHFYTIFLSFHSLSPTHPLIFTTTEHCLSPCPLSLHYNEGNYQLHHKLFLPPITVSLQCTPPLPSLLPLKPPKPPLSPIPHPIIHYLIPTTPPPSALTIA